MVLRGHVQELLKILDKTDVGIQELVLLKCEMQKA